MITYLIDEPVPESEGFDEMTIWATNFAGDIETKYQTFRMRCGPAETSEEEEFKHILNFGSKRGLAALDQPLDVNVPWDEKAAQKEHAAKVAAEKAARAKKRKAAAAAKKAGKGGKATAKSADRDIASESENDDW